LFAPRSIRRDGLSLSSHFLLEPAREGFRGRRIRSRRAAAAQAIPHRGALSKPGRRGHLCSSSSPRSRRARLLSSQSSARSQHRSRGREVHVRSYFPRCQVRENACNLGSCSWCDVSATHTLNLLNHFNFCFTSCYCPSRFSSVLAPWDS
jgi:hypothetical protein